MPCHWVLPDLCSACVALRLLAIVTEACADSDGIDAEAAADLMADPDAAPDWRPGVRPTPTIRVGIGADAIEIIQFRSAIDLLSRVLGQVDVRRRRRARADRLSLRHDPLCGEASP